MAASIAVVGVYRFSVTPELVSAQADELYGSADDLTDEEREDAERECREQLESLALIECLVHDADDDFEVGDFAQPESDQAPYEEQFLSADGEERLEVAWGERPEENPFRVAFYLHFWNPHAPLRTSYGEIPCPSAEEMTERLHRLVPFVPLD